MKVQDPHGAGFRAAVELVGETNDFGNTFMTDDRGALIAKRSPLGIYRAQVQQAGFAAAAVELEVRPAIPDPTVIKLSLASVNPSVTVDGRRATGSMAPSIPPMRWVPRPS